MTKGQEQILEVSDCCNAGFKKVDTKRYDASYEEEILYICNICGQECKVVELLVEDK